MQQRRKASFITLVVSAAVLVSLLTTGTVFVWAHGTSASHTASTGASLSSILSKATAFKPLHPAAYAQAKALANARAGQNQAAPAAPAPHAPTAFASFQGQDMLNPLVKITRPTRPEPSALPVMSSLSTRSSGSTIAAVTFYLVIR